jgi:hypothetical protein
MSKTYRVRDLTPAPKVVQIFWRDGQGMRHPCQLIEIDESKGKDSHHIKLLGADGEFVGLDGWTSPSNLVTVYIDE